jgi:hypothetical protein
MNRNSAVQLHIWQHLMHFVCFDEHINKGIARASLWTADFRVHPKTGLLCINPFKQRWQSQKPALNPDRIFGKDNIRYHRLKEIWYELRVDWIPADRDVYDFGLRQNVKKLSDSALCSFYGQLRVYGSAKRQLNTKEIRALGLPTD